MINTLFFSAQIIFLLIGPYILYKCFKFAQEEARKAFFDEDAGAGCMLTILIVFYGLNILSLIERLIERINQ